MAVRSLEVKLQIEWQSAKQKGTSATGWLLSLVPSRSNASFRPSAVIRDAHLTVCSANVSRH